MPEMKGGGFILDDSRCKPMFPMDRDIEELLKRTEKKQPQKAEKRRGKKKT